MDCLGLSVLSANTSSAVVDVVAVHGLGGTPLRTWTHRNGSLWLRDFLPYDIPQARVLTFGYDANIRGSTMNGFRESAQLLLSHLETNRAACRVPANRPIVFLCHSLGGIVVKEAIVKASLSHHYGGIRSSTISVLFFGTPHRGSRGASLGKILCNVAKVLSLEVSTTHLETLLPESKELDGLSSQFCNILATPPIDVINLFESTKTRAGFFSIMVVPKSSAVLDVGEHIHEGISLQGDHRQICQFPSRDDSQYVLVRGLLLQILHKRLTSNGGDLQCQSPHHEETWSWLQPYIVDELPALEGTCAWILQKSEFLEWQQSEKPLWLWIHGPPGTGKTFLSYYVANMLRGQSKRPVICVLCNAFSPLTSKIRHIVRSMIGQVLRDTSAASLAGPRLQKLRRAFPDISDAPLNEMLDLIVFLIQQTSISAIIIDGLDECNEEQLALNAFMRTLTQMVSNQTVSTKLLFVSRNVSFLQPFFSEMPALKIGASDTKADILLLTHHRLQDMQHVRSFRNRIMEVIAEKAQGLFIWAEVFLAGLEDVHSSNDVESYLANAKTDLDSTYRDVFKKLDQSRTQQADLRKRILTIVSAAVIPLRLNELEEALSVRPAVFGLDDADRLLQGWETLERLCSPLLQLENERVQLLHLSAREFILSSGKMVSSTSLPASAAEAHGFMAQICLTYLCLRKLENPVSATKSAQKLRENQHPLLRYATLYWIEHLIQSGTMGQVTHDLVQVFVSGKAGVDWAVSYFPQYNIQAGESQHSMLGILQTQISRLKAYLSNQLVLSPNNITIRQLMGRLDHFIVSSFERAVLLQSNSKGAAALSTLERRLDLSKAYQGCSDLQKSIEIANKILETAAPSYGPHSSLVLRCRHQILLVQVELTTETDGKAYELLRTAFSELSSLMSKHFEPGHIDLLRCRHDVGLTLLYGEKPVEASQIFQTVLSDMQKYLGISSALTQRTANNLALCYYHLQQLDEADMILNTIPEAQTVSGVEMMTDITACHPYTLDALHLMALVAYLRSNYERATTLQHRAIAGREHCFGPGDGMLYTYVHDLGIVFESQKRFPEAIDLYHRWQNKAKRVRLQYGQDKMRDARGQCFERWQSAVERGLLSAEGLAEARRRLWEAKCRRFLRTKMPLASLAVLLLVVLWRMSRV